MIKAGSIVIGKDIKGNSITGEVISVLNMFQVSNVRIGEDRLDIASCYNKDLRVIG